MGEEPAGATAATPVLGATATFRLTDDLVRLAAATGGFRGGRLGTGRATGTSPVLPAGAAPPVRPARPSAP